MNGAAVSFHSLSPSRQRIIAEIAKNPSARLRDIASAVGRSNPTVFEILRKLTDAGALVRVGKYRGYRVSPQLLSSMAACPTCGQSLSKESQNAPIVSSRGSPSLPR